LCPVETAGPGSRNAQPKFGTGGSSWQSAEKTPPRPGYGCSSAAGKPSPTLSPSAFPAPKPAACRGARCVARGFCSRRWQRPWQLSWWQLGSSPRSEPFIGLCRSRRQTGWWPATRSTFSPPLWESRPATSGVSVHGAGSGPGSYPVGNWVPLLDPNRLSASAVPGGGPAGGLLPGPLSLRLVGSPGPLP